jgi:hypothetical protein
VECAFHFQISPAKVKEGSKSRQYWLSVPCDDAGGLFFCYPWAVVDTSSGALSFCEKPSEYYGLQSAEHECYECDVEISMVSNDEPSKSSHVVAPLIVRGVEVDWEKRELANVGTVLSCIRELLDAEAEL